MTQPLLIGIDIGGTFTDVVALTEDGQELLAAFKIPSTPSDPSQAVLSALARIAQHRPLEGSSVFHGTTVGTNTLVEKKGARTALLATRGFSDVIELRRQVRPRLYDFDVVVSEPLVPPALRFEVTERVAADASVVTPVDAEAAMTALRSAAIESVAVSFLHAYANPAHEMAVVQMVRDLLPGVFVCSSSEVSPEFREYERTSTTVVNAYIGNTVAGYIAKLEHGLSALGVKHLFIVKSDGGLAAPRNAMRFPVHLIESGPAAQLIASAAYGRATARQGLVAFDMGGTTAKAGLIRDGQPETISEFYADRFVDGVDRGGYAIRSSVLDLVEIGAGGGSIAWIDEAKVLKVGPRSAGASPGPACYGQGGDRPTVTDAHVVIGTITPHALSGSGIELQRELAVDAIRKHVAEPFGWSLERAAYAIIDIAVANMADMVRVTTTRKALDPRDYPILASGGAGPLHATAVAAQIGSREVIIPPFPGMFSALGATLGSIKHELTQSVLAPLDDAGLARLTAAFAVLEERLAARLLDDQQDSNGLSVRRFVNVRYVGQLFELRVEVEAGNGTAIGIAQVAADFHAAYRQAYGHDLRNASVQIASATVVADLALTRNDQFHVSDAARIAPTEPRSAVLLARDGGRISIPVYDQSHRGLCDIDGPALIELSGSTVWVLKGTSAEIRPNGEIIVRLDARARP